MHHLVSVMWHVHTICSGLDPKVLGIFWKILVWLMYVRTLLDVLCAVRTHQTRQTDCFYFLSIFQFDKNSHGTTTLSGKLDLVQAWSHLLMKSLFISNQKITEVLKGHGILFPISFNLNLLWSSPHSRSSHSLEEFVKIQPHVEMKQNFWNGERNVRWAWLALYWLSFSQRSIKNE